jgi:hypothetical protein
MPMPNRIQKATARPTSARGYRIKASTSFKKKENEDTYGAVESEALKPERVGKKKEGRYDDVWLLMPTVNALEDGAHEDRSNHLDGSILSNHLDCSILFSLDLMNLCDRPSIGFSSTTLKQLPQDTRKSADLV